MEELLRSLINIPSVNPRSSDSGGEGALAGFVRDWFTERGVRATLHEVLPGRPNVVAVVPGFQRRAVLLETHLDTVEVEGMTVDPWAGVLRDGRMYGRGACDAKGSLAAFMTATARLAAGQPPPCTVVLAGVADEEYLYRGVLKLLDDLPQITGEVVGAIVGEPTDLALATAHRGVVRFTVRTLGVAGHSSRPAEAVNAISLMARAIAHLDATSPGVASLGEHPLLGPATRCVTQIRGGTGPNIIPGQCEIDVDRRTLPGEDPQEVWRRIGAELDALLPGQVEIDPPFNVDYALDTSPDAPIVTALQGALAGHGLDGTVRGMPFCTDASKIARVGIPAVVFGPGSIGDAHSSDESVALDDVRLAADIVVDAIRGL